MDVKDIRRILILGGGTMGQQIGFQCAIHGCEVVVYDIQEDMLETAMTRIKRLAGKFVKRALLTADAADAAVARIEVTTDPVNAAENVDLVSESVPEDPELKGRVFARFHELCPAHTIFTTNTSTLLPSMFAASTGRPERFLAFHFHDVAITNVVDVMPHPGTDESVVDLVMAFARKIGQMPILVKKENSGYVFNAMLAEFMKAAQTLAAKGVATVEDIDRAWMGVTHMFSGPFGIMDSIGLDTVWKVTDFWATKTGDPQSRANADFMKQYVDSGHLGTKTRRGFYSYPDPEFLRPDFLSGKNK